MKFRPHRGGLKESMDEMVEVDGISGLAKHLFVPESDIVIRKYDDSPDNRIGWNKTCIVVTRQPDGYTFRPAGFIDSDK